MGNLVLSNYYQGLPIFVLSASLQLYFFKYIVNKILRFYYEENRIYNIEILLFVFTNFAKHGKSGCFCTHCNLNKHFC